MSQAPTAGQRGDPDETSLDGEIVEPNASHMIESLRDIGYSFETAVADIIDNSISAAARKIDIWFGWDATEQPWLAIADNGTGMDAPELVEAMRPGGRDPLSKRKAGDLGRFGLGLKTASFSQCRKLTVVTVKAGVRSARQWDLDLVRSTNKWLLRSPSQAETEAIPHVPGIGDSGTVVLWEGMDRLDLGDDPERHHQIYNERIMSLREHIALVFHRFMASEPGYRKVTIAINNAPIEPFDPFNSKHAATIHLTPEVVEVENQRVTLRPYILPHHSMVSATEYDRLGGIDGYLKGQGFYIYRSRRLIIHGTWFRMTRQDEMSKLARVQVDIPNTLDHLWTIDVRKSRAHPPEAVKRRFKGVLERIKDSAKRPYTHRGTTSLKTASEPMWKRFHHNDRVTYSPNIDHPLLSEFRSDVPAKMRRRFEALLSIIGSSLPFPMLFNDMAARPKETERVRYEDSALKNLADILFPEAPADLKALEHTMLTTEPFASAPDFVTDHIRRLSK